MAAVGGTPLRLVEPLHCSKLAYKAKKGELFWLGWLAWAAENPQ